MKLFYTKRSPYARKVRIVAEEKRLPLDLAEEDLTDKSDELLRSNPVGKIPVLVLDDGRAFTDSPLICEYLDAFHDNPALIPRDSRERFKILNLAAVADGLMDVTVAAFMEKLRHGEDFNKSFIQSREETAKRCLKFFENHAGDLHPLSIASVAAACAIGYIEFRLPHLKPREGCPRLSEWFDEFSGRPSMASTAPVR